MTINIFVLKGDLNGKIVVVRFFFVGYIKIVASNAICGNILGSQNFGIREKIEALSKWVPVHLFL